jgi:hypothetical protein
VCSIAEKYGQKQIPQPKQLPEMLTTDDPYALLERTDYASIYKLRDAVMEHLKRIQGDKTKAEEYGKWFAWRTKSFEVQKRKRPPKP